MVSLKQRRKFSTELLAQEEGDALRRQQPGQDQDEGPKARWISSPERPTLREEWRSVALLVLLYMIQGVPLGLSMGSMPFLMQSRVSYTQIGIFSLASYPYSFKLLWSPIVDSVYSSRLGRRKSWIVPLQFLSAVVMLGWGGWVEARLDSGDAWAVTALFFCLDIAVDGWALTLLSKHNLGYASTCQTVGMNTGYFTSFTIFLALSDPDFCNKYLRSGVPHEKGILTLSGYLRFWGWVYLTFTLLLALFKREAAPVKANGSERGVGALSAAKATPAVPVHTGSNGSARGSPRVGSSAAGSNGKEQQHEGYEPGEAVLPLRESYLQLWRVVRLPAVRAMAAVLVICRLGMLPAEAAAPLKLLEKGATKEALAGLVLITFPTELISAVVAGRWATSPHPFTPWLIGYRMRLALAALSTLAVYHFPHGAALVSDAPAAFAAVAAVGVATSFTSTLMFTALGSFYNRISDPSMGGAYLTLLNTIANLGFTLPKIFIFAAMDWMTVRECRPVAGSTAWQLPAGANEACCQGGSRVLPRLERLPLQAWRSRRPASD
ncbi:hypothetical protein N2152v2_000229 [Parachlorella kessleri]